MADNQVTPSYKYPKGGNRGMTQAYQFRDQSAEQALVLRELPATLDPKDIALRALALRDLNAVWDSASERLRILRGRPLPGSLKPEKKRSKAKAQYLGPIEDLPTEQGNGTEQQSSV